MKILFFIDSLGSGGKERRLVELMKSLKNHHEIEFNLVVMSHNIHYKEVLELGIPIHYLVRKRKKDVTVFSQLYKLCKSFKPDILHCWESMTAIYSVPVCKILSIPLINGMVIDSPQKQKILNKHWIRAKLVFPFSNHIVGNSKAGISAYGASATKSHVIHNGFNFNRTENLKEKNLVLDELKIKTRYVVGMVASFSDYKDYKTYFEAAQLILTQRKDVTFLAVGNRTESFPARRLIDWEISPFIKLLGKKSDVESLINIMDICVLSTFTEGISNSILEYMAMGKPVIATDGGGTNEIIESGKTGFLVNVSDATDLSNKIQLLLNNESMRLNMGENGKKRIEEYFTIEKMKDNYISLYHSIVST